MAKQEKVDALRLGFSIMQGKPEGDYMIIESNEKELMETCVGYKMEMLKEIKKDLAKDIEQFPNLVNDQLDYKILLFVSVSSVILQAPLAITRSGLRKYMYGISAGGKPRRIKTIKTLVKNLREYFTEETTSWECGICKKDSLAFEPVFLCENKDICLKCLYEKDLGKDVTSIKYSNGGEMLNILKTHFLVKSISNKFEFDREIKRMIGIGNNFSA